MPERQTTQPALFTLIATLFFVIGALFGNSQSVAAKSPTSGYIQLAQNNYRPPPPPKRPKAVQQRTQPKAAAPGRGAKAAKPPPRPSKAKAAPRSGSGAKVATPKRPSSANLSGTFKRHGTAVGGQNAKPVGTVPKDLKKDIHKHIGKLKSQVLRSNQETTNVVGGKYTKSTQVRKGKDGGQSRAEYTRFKNPDGKTIKTYKDSYDRANRWKHRKPLKGGPEGRNK